VKVLGWAIAAAAIVCVAVRPVAALHAAARGTDVYLFLIGMMALGGYAQHAGVFAWIAEAALRIAGRSRARFFALVYVTGIGTTALLSNDATIVVLTPAVLNVLRRYEAAPLPYVVACALVANAASFVLPIANPSNLLVFAGRMPSLGAWLLAFGLPSAAACAVTYAVLRWCYRRELSGTAAIGDEPPAARPDALALAVLGGSAAVVVVTSALGGMLGAATFACALCAWLLALARDRSGALQIAREIAWRIVALTAALFVIVSALDDAGGFAASRFVLAHCAALAWPWSPLAAGFAVAAASNALNNLPVGLNLGEVLPGMHATLHETGPALIGVNLGPNATANGSLATLLWLAIVQRADVAVSPLAFARIGIVTAVPALIAALLLLPH
jgi:arsenical pump membrane protein